jgi:hypothetical protein
MHTNTQLLNYRTSSINYFSLFSGIRPLFDEIVPVLEFPKGVSKAEVNVILRLIPTDFVNLVVVDFIFIFN